MGRQARARPPQTDPHHAGRGLGIPPERKRRHFPLARNLGHRDAKSQATAKLTLAVVGELDGEITVFDGDRPSFAMLQRRMHVTRPASALVAAVPVTYVAFDLLRQARSLLCSPYAQRRALLDGLALAAEHVSVPLRPLCN